MEMDFCVVFCGYGVRYLCHVSDPVFCTLKDTFCSCLAYNCGKLAITTVNAVHEVCKEWKSNMPKLMKSKNVYEIYMHSEQNTRRRMEDKHIVLTEFNNLCGLDKVSFG
jgi:hypothetical protein